MKRMNFPTRRDQRRVEAQERQAAWDALSDEQKVAKVRARCGHGTSNEELRLVAKEA